MIVGTPEYSDYPEDAKRVPRIGNANGIDLERIAALRPDLIVAWQSGNPSWVLDHILQSNMTVFLSEPRKIEDIASNIERLGLLTGNAEVARQASWLFRERYRSLQSIGDLGPEAGRFVDWLADAGQSVWQVLPLGPTGYGDSPYAPYSSFAGDALLLSPELLRRDGLSYNFV